MNGISFRGITVPEAELEWSFDTSGGPGGQHANRNETRVTLSFDVERSPSLPDEVRDRVRDRLDTQMAHGVLKVVVDESRSQWRNRAIARERLADMLDEALTPRRRRRATRPSRSAKRRRLRAKRHRGRIKRLRRPPDIDE